VLARETVEHTSRGFRTLMGLARRFPRRTWAVEGCNGVGKNLAQRLVAGGETVLDVSTRKSSLVRASATNSGRKTDDTDAYSKMTVVSTERLADVFVELADTLVDDFDVIEFLMMVAHRTSELIGDADVGILLADQRGHLQFMAGSNEDVKRQVAAVRAPSCGGGLPVCARLPAPASRRRDRSDRGLWHR
jgi:hypothetical protein